MEWRTKTLLVDMKTGEELKKNKLNNYELHHIEKKINYDNREIEQTKLYKRRYITDLFGNE